MASDSPKPSSSSESHHVSAEMLPRDVLCDVNYVSDSGGLSFQEENLIHQFKADSALSSVVNENQFSIDPCSSTSSYAQILRTHHDASLPPGSPNSSPNLLCINEEQNEDSHHSNHMQEPDDHVTLNIDQLNLHQVSIVHPGLPNIGPIILDRNSLAALISSSRDGTFTLDVSSLQRSLLSSHSEPSPPSPPPRAESQYLPADGSLSMLPPMLSQKDLLSTMLSAPSTSSATPASTSFPINHKQMLAQKYAAEMLGEQHHSLVDGIGEHRSDSYVVSSDSRSSLIDSGSMAVYGDVSASTLSDTSVSRCLPLDVYGMDGNVSLVSSSRDSPEMHESVEFSGVGSHSSSHHSVQNYMSSTVDLVHSHQLDHGMHCTVDSTVGPKLHPDENIVDSSDGYGHHLESSDVLHSTSEVDDLQNCATVSSATHPDSTHSPGISGDASPSYSLASTSLQEADYILESEFSRPRRDLRSHRHWCDDCATFYDKECTQHRIQLIFDKPVLSRAWASLPAQYLFVNKIAHDEHGDPVYGVFAKKTIPKRTQFGPVEGVLVKRDDPPSDYFVLLVENNEGKYYLDTGDESLSNWMRFVRPADSHKEQNLVLVQQGQSLYFNTTKSINPRTELRVWYSTQYAERWGLPVLEPNEEERKALQEQENAWPCFECNQRFSSSEELQKHLNQHDEENAVLGIARVRPKTRVRTKLGKKGFLSIGESGASGEMAAKKARGRPGRKYKFPTKDEYKCDICLKSFPRNYSLQRHLIMHTGEKKYKCPICDIKFSHVYNRNRHVRRHKRNPTTLKAMKPIKSLFKKKQGPEWICMHCGLTFDNSNVLNLHTLTHAAEDIALNDVDPFLESIVDEDFDDSDESKMVCEEIYKCPECTQNFATRRDLIQHASVHGTFGKRYRSGGNINPLKPYKCNLCYKSFASDERLIKHYLVHGSEDSKPLQCDICYKRFLNNSALACHIKVHSDERKFYECPICKNEFDQIIALKEHVHVHCQDGIYNCPNCNKMFEEYNQVRKHIRAFHSERRYPCEKCDKIFPRPDKLKLHMLRHSDHREFLCANCGKQFKRKDKLKEHMKRMHAPDREAKVNAKNTKITGSKKFIPKVSPTDYHRFIYKCHSCLLGFKRRGMLVNHLAKRHPDIRPDSVPELNLPILKTTRDYYCQYCEKVYKSSSKRKAHILKNHPGSELPMSNRRKGGVPEIPGIPNPTFSQTVGSITTHPHHCNWCHKQYASKAKLLQHQRKKHVDMLALSYVANNTKVEPVCDQSTQVNGQIVIENLASLSPEAASVLINASKKIHYVDKDSIVVTANADGLPTADLLTQAMSELTQSFQEYRPGELLPSRLTNIVPINIAGSPRSSPIPSESTNPDSPPPSILDNAQLDQIQLNQLIQQYIQQQNLNPTNQQLAVVVTSLSKPWSAGTTSISNYPAR